MNNKIQKLTLDLLDFLKSGNYIDLFEDLYDSQKYLNRKINNNEDYLVELKELWVILNDSIRGNNQGVIFLDNSSNLEIILNRLQPFLFLQENRDFLLEKLLNK